MGHPLKIQTWLGFALVLLAFPLVLLCFPLLCAPPPRPPLWNVRGVGAAPPPPLWNVRGACAPPPPPLWIVRGAAAPPQQNQRKTKQKQRKTKGKASKTKRKASKTKRSRKLGVSHLGGGGLKPTDLRRGVPFGGPATHNLTSYIGIDNHIAIAEI